MGLDAKIANRKKELQNKSNLILQLQINSNKITVSNRREALVQIREESDNLLSLDNPLCKDEVYSKLCSLARKYNQITESMTHNKFANPQYFQQHKKEEYFYYDTMKWAIMTQLRKISDRKMQEHEYTFFEKADEKEIQIAINLTEDSTRYHIIPKPMETISP